MFVQGSIYKRSDLHERYGGQSMGGISTPADQQFIMLFTGASGQQYGYHDGWSEDGVFLYTGEGQTGDMQFVRGNLAIRDHEGNGKDIHLFEIVKKGYVRYIGQMVCTGYNYQRGPDVDGNDRQVIVFEFTPVDEFGEISLPADDKNVQEMWQQSLATLRKRAVASSQTAKTPTERKALVRQRSAAIRVYVLRRANGICEACGANAPFKTSADRPYLESHHIRRLSDWGPDDPAWVIGVCPNCHRKAHHSKDKDSFNKELSTIVHDKEKDYRDLFVGTSD